MVREMLSSSSHSVEPGVLTTVRYCKVLPWAACLRELLTSQGLLRVGAGLMAGSTELASSKDLSEEKTLRRQWQLLANYFKAGKV